MEELYDWAKEAEQAVGGYSAPVRQTSVAPYDMNRLPSPPPIRLMQTTAPSYPYHGTDCWCSSCGGGPVVRNSPTQSSPLLDKVVALVVAFAAMIVGGIVLLPLIMPLLVILLLFVVAAVAGLAVLLGIVRAVTDRPAREHAGRGRARR